MFFFLRVSADGFISSVSFSSDINESARFKGVLLELFDWRPFILGDFGSHFSDWIKHFGMVAARPG